MKENSDPDKRYHKSSIPQSETMMDDAGLVLLGKSVFIFLRIDLVFISGFSKFSSDTSDAVEAQNCWNAILESTSAGGENKQLYQYMTRIF